MAVPSTVPGSRARIALFGAGSRGVQVLAALRDDPRVEVAGIFDNDRAKWGTALHGVPIWEPTAAQGAGVDAIVVASLYGKEILAQLTALGLRDKVVLSLPRLARRLDGHVVVPPAEDAGLSAEMRRDRYVAAATGATRALAARLDTDPPPPPARGDAWACEVACTICGNNYVAYATVLARSFLRQHPGGRFFLCLADRRRDDVAYPVDPRITVLDAAELGIPAFEAMAFKYDVLEFNTAVKPFLLEHLLRDHGAERLLYLDPDILVLAPLTPLFEALATTSLVLTPHLRAPYADDHHPREIDILRAGTYNLGFAGLAATPQTWALLTWWQARLTDGCTREIERGYFVDQKWMDLVPSFFPDHRVIREAGYNAAYWNLHERTITRDGDTFLADGLPLRFFHFSGVDVQDLDAVSKHQTRFTLPAVGPLRDLFELYGLLLVTHGQFARQRVPYAYGVFDDGVAIPDVVRRIYREAALPSVYPAPFATGPGSFAAWLRAPWPEHPSISNLFGALVARCSPPLDLTADDFVVQLALDAEAERHRLPAALADPRPAAPETPAPAAPPSAPASGAWLRHVGASTTSPAPTYVSRALAAAAAALPASLVPADVRHYVTALQAGQVPAEAELWVPSSFSLDHLARTRIAPVAVVPLPVDVVPSSHRTRDALHLPAEGALVVAPCDRDTEGARDFTAIVAAARRAVATAPAAGLRLVLATSDPRCRPALDAAAREAGDAVLVRVYDDEDLRALAAHATAAVSIHGALAWDAWVAQALADGCPVIASNTGGLTDVVTVNTGYLLPTGDREAAIAAAATALHDVIADPMGRAARAARARQDLATSHGLAATVRAMSARLARRREAPALVA